MDEAEAEELSPLDCPVCCEVFTDPKLLVCNHMVCSRCLVKWITKKGKDAGCPLCQAAILSPSLSDHDDLQSLVDALPTDQAMVAKVENAQMLGSHHVCMMCDNNTAAVAFCLQCNMKLCRGCAKGHTRSPYLKSHLVEELDDMTEERLVEVNRARCKTHDDRPAELYCDNHQKLICTLCVTTDHSGCSKVKVIKDAATEKREKFSRQAQTLRQRETAMRTQVKQIKDSLADMHADVNRVYDDLRLCLENRRQAFHDIIKTEEERVGLSEIEQVRASTLSLAGVLDDHVQSAPDDALLDMESVIMSRLGHLEEQASVTDRMPLPADIRFDPQQVAQLKSAIGALDYTQTQTGDGRDNKSPAPQTNNSAVRVAPQAQAQAMDGQPPASKPSNKAVRVAPQSQATNPQPSQPSNKAVRVAPQSQAQAMNCQPPASQPDNKAVRVAPQSQAQAMNCQPPASQPDNKAVRVQVAPQHCVINLEQPSASQTLNNPVAMAPQSQRTHYQPLVSQTLNNPVAMAPQSQRTHYQPLVSQTLNNPVAMAPQSQRTHYQPLVSQTLNNPVAMAPQSQRTHYQPLVSQTLNNPVAMAPQSQTTRYQPSASQTSDVRRTAQQYQSLGYQRLDSSDNEEEDYGATRGPWVLHSSVGGGQGTKLDCYNMEVRGAAGGHPPPCSSAPQDSSSSPGTPTTNYARTNHSAVGLSRKQFHVGHRLKLKIYVDDITRTRTDIVVNASNWDLKHIEGVSWALAKAAGPAMERDCEKIIQERGPLRTAEVVKMRAYGKLSHLKYVFHTVGPIYKQNDPDRCVFELAQTFLNSLMLAESHCLESLTFPFISVGLFGMPLEHCVLALFMALKKFDNDRYKNLATLEEVHVINDDINVVCNAVMCAEMSAKTETAEVCVKRMEDGERLYGRGIWPFCDEKASPASKARSRKDNLAVSRSRARSLSAERGSKTGTASGSDTKWSRNAKGRDPSPIPRPLSRSNSLTSTTRWGSSSTAMHVGRSASPETPLETNTRLKQSMRSASGRKKKSKSRAHHVARRRVSDQSTSYADTASATVSETKDTHETCPVCLDGVPRLLKLPCGDRVCSKCVARTTLVGPQCPECLQMFRIPTGTQPTRGKMTYSIIHGSHLAGYPGSGMITITYEFPPDRQAACHPNPGRWFEGTTRLAYLPANQEGREVLKMLQKAFDHGLVFTIGDSVSTGAKGIITWSDIHHKTSTYEGQFGYPDPNYLHQVREELASKGIFHA